MNTGRYSTRTPAVRPGLLRPEAETPPLLSGRRTFLRGLASLPLIGGSVAILGQPTRAAAPVETWMLDRYCGFLAIELRESVIQVREMLYASHPERWPGIREHVEESMWAPDFPQMIARLAPHRPADRCQIVMSAVGCPL